RRRPRLVALCKVVVRRDEVHAVACEGVEIERLCGDEGFAFARLHLGDVALVEDDAAHQLDVEQADAQRALDGLPYSGEGVEEQLVEGLAVRVALAELRGLTRELPVRE